MRIKNTKTEQNLLTALQGESVARNKYTFYASQAYLEGNKEIAALFEKMAANESAHAMVWYKLLNNGMDGSLQNLQAAAEAEYGEWHSMYPSFAEQAREDDLEGIAIMFEKIAEIEKDHERQFLEAFMKLNAGIKTLEQQQRVLQQLEELVKTQKAGYRCAFCGAVYEQRPDACEVCHAIGSFEHCMIEGK